MKSPRIHVIVEGIKIPMVIDTGAQVSLLSTEVMKKRFPHGPPTCNQKQVRALGDNMVTVNGPIRLFIEICNLVIKHDFYFCSEIERSILGYDLISAAALVIDSESGRVWSNHTLRHRLHPEESPFPTLPYEEFTAITSEYASLSHGAMACATTNTLSSSPGLPTTAVSTAAPVGNQQMEMGTSCISDDGTKVNASTTVTTASMENQLNISCDMALDDLTHASSEMDGSTGTLDSGMQLTERFLDNAPGYFVDMLPIAEPACIQTDAINVEGTPLHALKDGLHEHVSMLFLQTVANCEISYQAQKGLEQTIVGSPRYFCKIQNGYCLLSSGRTGYRHW